MKAAKGKGAKRPNSALQKSPNKKAKEATKAQPSILSFFGKGKADTKPAVQEGEDDDDVVPIDASMVENVGGEKNVDIKQKQSEEETGGASAAHLQTKPGAQEADVEVIDLDASDGDTRSSFSSKTSDHIPNHAHDSPAKTMMHLKCESSTPSEAPATRNLLNEYYDPEKDACWNRGQPAPFLHLARAFHLIENEKGRLKMRLVIGNMFRSILVLSPEDLLPAVYLTTGKIAPAHEGQDLNVGGSTVADAVAEVAGVNKSRISSLYAELGDLGDVAQALRGRQRLLLKPAPLGIRGVYQGLRSLAKEGGGGSGARKKGIIMGLLRGCREEEMRYLVRTLIQNMRIGMNTTLVLGALAYALVMETGGRAVPGYHPHAGAAQSDARQTCGAKREEDDAIAPILLEASSSKAKPAPIKGKGKGGRAKQLQAEIDAAAKLAVDAYRECPNLDVLVKAMLEGGMEGVVDRCTVTLGVPFKPMLAKVATGMADALGKLEKRYGKEVRVLGEYKYDGQRAMLHVGAAECFSAFSRNCEDCTGAYPDVKEVLLEAAAGRSMVVDGELVAVDRETGSLRPFQHLSTRARGDVNKGDVTVQVCVFVFDLLVLDGRSLVRESLQERRRLLREAMGEVREAGKAGPFKGRVEFAKAVEVEGGAEGDGVQAIESFLRQSLDEQCEGLVVKALAERYEPGRRSDGWLKVKKDYVDGLADTLDLVPIGAWNGNGRKAGWLSPWLMAVQDPESGELQSVCRVMSGFTDEFYKAATARFLPRALPSAPPYYATRESPPYWFPASEVWEIRGAEVTESPVHMGAVSLTGGGRGLAIRFPRFIGVREDKNVEDASTPELVMALFQKQANRQGPRQQAADDADAEAMDGQQSGSDGQGEGEEEVGEECEEI